MIANVLLSIVIFLLPADQPFEPQTSQPPATITDSSLETTSDASFSHALWTRLLNAYVSAEGKVNYEGMLADKAVLQKYTATLSANPPQPNWSREETMAYWINAYNAFTVQLILDHYPVSSLRDIHKGNPWDVAWIKIGNKNYSLDNIENDILRPRFKDARIHFALNCAAQSCPPLLNEAFSAKQLEAQLEGQTRRFINDQKFNKINPNEANLSKIFDWYGEDFGNLRDFINQYSYVKLTPGAEIKFSDYNWSLNKQ
jgi:hypothetical protein